MKILVFTEGTAIMPAIAVSVTREERVKQSATNMPGVNDFRSYVPNGNAVAKLKEWMAQGAEIYYLTSRTSENEIDDVRSVLVENGFPSTDHLLYRHEGQEYKDVAEQLVPDLLIEDDCESIGGESEMTYPHINPSLKSKVHSIVVPEFAGIDHLPSDLKQLI